MEDSKDITHGPYDDLIYEMDLKFIWDAYIVMGLEPSEELKKQHKELFGWR